MRVKRVLVGAVSVAMAAAGLAACGTDDPDAENTASQLLGIVSIASGIDLNDNATQGAIDAAEAAGWEVEVVDAAGDASRANAAITNFANRGAGMIFVHVFPSAVLGSGLNDAAAAGVPVASWGGGAGTGVLVDTVTPLGGIITERMIDDLGGEGEVLALTYQGGQLCIDREALFDEVLAGYPDIAVTKEEVTIPGFLEQGGRYANAWLASRPAESGNYAVWGCWDDPTLGAISSLNQQGRTDVLTYGIQGSKTAVAAIQEGTLTATAFQDGYNEAGLMFETMLEAIEAGDAWEPKTLELSGEIISSDNLDAFLEEHPEFAG